MQGRIDYETKLLSEKYKRLVYICCFIIGINIMIKLGDKSFLNIFLIAFLPLLLIGKTIFNFVTALSFSLLINIVHLIAFKHYFFCENIQFVYRDFDNNDAKTFSNNELIYTITFFVIFVLNLMILESVSVIVRGSKEVERLRANIHLED